MAQSSREESTVLSSVKLLSVTFNPPSLPVLSYLHPFLVRVVLYLPTEIDETKNVFMKTTEVTKK